MSAGPPGPGMDTTGTQHKIVQRPSWLQLLPVLFQTGAMCPEDSTNYTQVQFGLVQFQAQQEIESPQNQKAPKPLSLTWIELKSVISQPKPHSLQSPRQVFHSIT